MPATSRVTIKASIVYLAVGAILGALLFIHRWLPLGPAIPVLKITHVHFLIVGWLTQLILGVAWWLFPPLKIGRERGSGTPRRRGTEQRGSAVMFWANVSAEAQRATIRTITERIYALPCGAGASFVTGAAILTWYTRTRGHPSKSV